MSLLPGAGTGQGTGQRLQGRLWSPLSWILLCLPLPISFPQHHFCTWAWQVSTSLDTSAIQREASHVVFFAQLEPCPCHLTCLSWKMPPVLTSLAGVTSTGQYSPFSFSSRIWTHSSTLRVTSLHLHNESNAGLFLSFGCFFPHRKKKELKHQNTELRLQIEAATTAAVNAPFVSTQVPAVQCFYIFLTAISVKHQK